MVLATSMIRLWLLHSTQSHQKFKTTQEMSAFCVQKGHGQAKSRVKCTTWTLSVWSCKKESLDTYHVPCDTKGSHNKKKSLHFFVALFSHINQFLPSTLEYVISVTRNVKYFYGKQKYPSFFFFFFFTRQY